MVLALLQLIYTKSLMSFDNHSYDDRVLMILILVGSLHVPLDEVAAEDRADERLHLRADGAAAGDGDA
eukprot:10325-Pyramimonas_sp.AAC.1